MIPLGKSTAVLPEVQGVAVGNRGFPLTLLRISAPRQLSAICVSSSPYRTPSPVLRKIKSSERRRSSVSSVSRESKVYKEQEFWKRELQGALQIENKSVDLTVQGSQQIHQKFLIKMTSEKQTISSLELKAEQSLEFSSGYSSQEDVQAPSPSESKNLSKSKNKISLSRTSKSSNKSRKLSKSRKSCKRRNSTKFSRKIPTVFERLTNTTFKNDINHNKGKSKNSSSTRNDLTVFHNNEACGTLLEIRQLQATYSPRRSSKPKTFLLLPKVPRLTKLENISTRTTIIKKDPENIKTTDSNNSQVTSPRKQISIKMNSRREEYIDSCKKIYLSEMQSKAIGGVPSAPPGTPSSDQLKKIEYVPSLMDIKSQRAIKSKLEKIVHKLRIEEQHRKENSMKQDQKKIKESLIQLKQRQRLEIYALNRVMTEGENENFKKFMDKKEAVSLGV